MSSVRHPPKPRFNLAVGITGHRPPVIESDRSLAERAQLKFVLSELARGAALIAADQRSFFAEMAFVPRLISPLAEGADQLAADVALDLGYSLHAILPFSPEEYCKDFSPAGVSSFNRLLARASAILELPHQHLQRDEAYSLAGRATVSHCDILIALWDGEAARGPGGTAETVALALRPGIPVIHITVGEQGHGRILWTGYGEFVDPDDFEALPTRAVTASELAKLCAAILGPPPNSEASADLITYLNERERRVRTRAEYPLLLAVLGVKRITRAAFRTAAYRAITRAEWRPFHEACGSGRHGVRLEMEEMEEAFAWADHLAQHFAQTYRSGNILNFCLAALAVLLALAGLLLPRFHFWLALGEPLAIAAFVLNTFIGGRAEWHRRWLEYRQLAERIRPMRSLKLLGAAAPPSRGLPSGPSEGWVEWYARAQWRAAGPPEGRLVDVSALFVAIVAEEIEPQIGYHRSSAHQMHRLDHRLHALGMFLFIVSILGCVASIIASAIAPQFAYDHSMASVAISAGLPAVGAAIFGIRMQGDFGGTAERSLVTANELGRIVHTLGSPRLRFARRLDLIEAAATTMLSELGEWRRDYQRRKLELPG